MQRIVFALAVSAIWAAAASPSPASATAQDHVKAKHAKAKDAKRIQAREKKPQGVLKKAQRLVESKSKATKPHAERNPKHVANIQRIVKKAHEHGLVQVEPNRGGVRATTETELDAPDTANALVDLAMRYDGKNPTGWSHNWCARYLEYGPPGGWLSERRQFGARIRILRPADPRSGWCDCRDAEPRRRRGLRRGRLRHTRQR